MKVKSRHHPEIRRNKSAEGIKIHGELCIKESWLVLKKKLENISKSALSFLWPFPAECGWYLPAAAARFSSLGRHIAAFLHCCGLYLSVYYSDRGYTAVTWRRRHLGPGSGCGLPAVLRSPRPRTLRPGEAQCGPARSGLARPGPCPARSGAALGELMAPPGVPRPRLLPRCAAARPAVLAVARRSAGSRAQLGGTFLRTRS